MNHSVYSYLRLVTIFTKYTQLVAPINSVVAWKQYKSIYLYTEHKQRRSEMLLQVHYMFIKLINIIHYKRH